MHVFFCRKRSLYLKLIDSRHAKHYILVIFFMVFQLHPVIFLCHCSLVICTTTADWIILILYECSSILVSHAAPIISPKPLFWILLSYCKRMQTPGSSHLRFPGVKISLSIFVLIFHMFHNYHPILDYGTSILGLLSSECGVCKISC